MSNTISLGVGRRDVTPKVGCQLFGYNPNHFSSSILDNLSATSYVFEYESKKVALISVDICAISNELDTTIRGLIEKECGIKKDDIVLCAIHTHTGPNTNGGVGMGGADEEYNTNVLIPNIVEATKEANDKLVPVKMGLLVGESKTGINRRQTLPDYSICLGQNEWGYYDPKMTVMSFRDFDGNVIGNIIHYTAHATCLGTASVISRDWPGIMVDAVERESGAPTAFVNGCEGDVGPRLTNGATVAGGNGDDRAIACMREVGGVAALDAVRIYKQIKSFYEVSADAVSGTVTLPLKDRISIEEANRLLDEIPAESVNWRAGKRAHCERVLEAYKNNVPIEKDRSFEQTILRVGDVAFATIPTEPFCQIGLMIQKLSPIPYTLPLSNANGCFCFYFPNQEELCRGGYEINQFTNNGTQPFTDDADQSLIYGTLDNIKKLK